MEFFKKLSQFVRETAGDERIPSRDRKILLGLVALMASPIDLIPDWIPVIGVLDDLIMLAIVLDYLFNVLEEDILLSHYPWTMKSFVRMRKMARAVAFLTPSFIKNKIWSYQASPYRK